MGTLQLNEDQESIFFFFPIRTFSQKKETTKVFRNQNNQEKKFQIQLSLDPIFIL